ncbi:beta-1,2-xylosyltransferase [Impatiens glandulifera]|uniref:beta-1,2-xylosyltransferase n=1 Tax=Impatiens glandulifera TaxID=253017 RepID=UPI001FB0FAB1|nr:beta-1,2-xylosyltransferase [Impatiens glandulifera]
MHVNSRRLKVLLFLFFLNSVSLYLYFSAHPDYFRHYSKEESARSHTGNRHTLTENRQHFQFPLASTAKPWPILPSYLPWSINPNVSLRSCESYFGNGFTRRIDVLESATLDIRRKSVDVGGRGWFRCYYSETLRSSICEGGWIRMHPEKIRMSIGGENLEVVIGRGEEEELPDFEAGAFDIEVTERSIGDGKLVDAEFLDNYLHHGVISRHTVRALVDSIRLVGTRDFECAEWIEEPTLLVTRFEYANLFHTVTDWYSAYVSSRVTDLPSRPHLVFVDGHCAAPLEETWKALFSSLKYAKNFTGPVCFRHAILSPLGYETALFKGLTEDLDCHGASARDLWQKPDLTKTARISEFGEMIRASFGFPVDRHRSMKPTSTHNVLFVRREDYLAHPRHGGKVESRLSNEQEVFDSVKNWLANGQKCKINLVNGLFAHMPMKDQVRAIQDASVIIGAHGAGLTHIVSATPRTIVLEIISSEFRRPHFSLISEWKGLEYHAINLVGSYANPSEVIENLGNILHSLRC